MTLGTPLEMSWGAARVELRTERPRLRAVLAHAFRPFVIDDCAEVSAPGVDEGEDLETWIAVVDGREYSFSSLGTAVSELVYVIAERLLSDISDGLLLHSAAVADGDRTIMILGPSGSGKTTLSLEFVRRGYLFITDEYVAVDPSGATLRPFPRSAVLKKVVNELPAGDHVVFDRGHGYRSYLMPRRRSDLEPKPLHEVWMIFATHREGGAEQVRDMEPGEVLARILPCTFEFDGRAAALWPALSSVATRAKACVLEYRDAAAGIDLALDRFRRK